MFTLTIYYFEIMCLLSYYDFKFSIMYITPTYLIASITIAAVNVNNLDVKLQNFPDEL